VDRDQGLFSIVYDRKEDRLTLSLKSVERKVEGKLTRRLLRDFIESLPAWLDRQVAEPVPPQVMKAVAKKPASGAVAGASKADRQPGTPSLVCNTEKNTHFLIETISLSPLRQLDGKSSIRLGFISQGAQQKIGFKLALDEFAGVISALVEKPEGWGLVHPWPKYVESSMTQYNGRIFH